MIYYWVIHNPEEAAKLGEALRPFVFAMLIMFVVGLISSAVEIIIQKIKDARSRRRERIR